MEKDHELWKLAKRRVSLKWHLAIYIAVNILAWLGWFIQFKEHESHKIAWPVYCTLGWGIWLLMHYAGAYHAKSKTESIEKEYEKLKNNFKK